MVTKKSADRKMSGLWDDITPFVNALMSQEEDELRAVPQMSSAKARPRPDSTPAWQEETHAYLPEVAAAVQSDLDETKERYIVGKTVGQDLFDDTGRKVAMQGNRITRELVRDVERLGLLVELIEHMVFDSFDL